jgi:NAD(P)-dependent dehydrogenase (short-subunit alcohol dehydrogenase family)
MSESPFGLRGRTVLVTGASSGIGRETAIRISRLGGTIVGTGRSVERLEAMTRELEGEGHQTVPADLTMAADVARLVEACPQLDGVVHSAGQIKLYPVRLYNEGRLEGLTGINYRAPLVLTAELLKRGKILEGASIVMLSSIMSTVGTELNGIYAGTKGALAAVARCLALELAPRRIRVNSVAPAFVMTPMLERLGQQIELAPFQDRHPLAFGMAADVANAITFLLSDAGRWITGTNMILDGGYSAR